MQDEAHTMSEQTSQAQEQPSQIGVILVHGIGEQGRFEHLDTHIRGVVAGFKRSGAAVTVEIMSADSAGFHSVQDTWRGGPDPSIRLLVRHGIRLTIVNVHEVWWADINEPYSVMKQVRFWVWGLSVWRYPRQDDTLRPETAFMMAKPLPPLGSWTEAWVRLRLFAIGCTFLMSSLTIGVTSALATRLFHFKPPRIVQTFVNYLSSVKLYNQSERCGVGIRSNADFLDTIGEPPRDSIRRRMIRTIADVACNKEYARWYILAHSLGSVVAFNGLMEPGRGWVGYLDEDRLKTLRGAAMVSGQPPDKKPMIPPRPLWSADGEAVDRTMVFAKFAGLLTYGSPLEKFVAIWPGRVPVFMEPAFGEDTSWVNIFDPTDSVSGVIHSWATLAPAFCPKVTNIGYRSDDRLLLGHVKYLECPYALSGELYGERLADHVASWLLGDRTALAGVPAQTRFFQPHGPRARRRGYSGMAQWVLVFAALTALAAYLVPRYPYMLDSCGCKPHSWGALITLSFWQPLVLRLWHALSTLPSVKFASRCLEFLGAVAAVTFVFGLALAPKRPKIPAAESERV